MAPNSQATTSFAEARAEALKAQGNEKYKVRRYDEAIKLYKAAIEMQPNVPVYWSNLSAVQLEDGQYSDALKSCQRALALIAEANAKNTALKTKLLVRRAKVLLILYADDESYLEEAKVACDALPEGDTQKAALRRRRIARAIEDVVNTRISTMPRYRQPMKRTLEHYTVGHDNANSIFRVQYSDSEMNEGPEHPYAKRFHIKIPKDGKPFDFSAMFCGIGDARHLYASIADLAVDMRDLKKVKSASQKIKVHFTLIDVHPTSLARDLLLLMAMDEISRIPASERPTHPRAQELFLMLHYVFWGTTMPPAAHDIMSKAITQLYNTLHTASDEGDDLELDWLYIDAKAVTSLAKRLKWWLDEGKTKVTFDQILPPRIDSDPGRLAAAETEVGPIPQEHRDTMREIQRKRRDDMYRELTESVKTDPKAHASLSRAAAQGGLTLQEYIDQIANETPEQKEQRDMLMNAPENATCERIAFRILRVMTPPAHANEPKGLEALFKQIRKNLPGQFLDPSVLKAAHKKIRERWYPNYTLLDQDWFNLSQLYFPHCPFQGVQHMLLSETFKAERPKMKSGGIYDWSVVFFGLVADGMSKLREGGGPGKDGGLKLEFVLGDGYAFMDDVRMGSRTGRKETFPTSFDRIHSSNVPDYVGGHLSTFTTALPLIKSHPAAYFTSCSLLNSNAWEGKFMKEFEKHLDSSLWTYASVTRSEIAAAYGAELCCIPSYPGNYHTFRRLDVAPPNRLDRHQLLVLLYSIFFKTVLPVQYKRYNEAISIREPQNVNAFFRLVEILKLRGYPQHLLLDVVESILENRATSGFAPHDTVPVPLSARQKPLSEVCTTPFVAEFEVAAALWESRLFPICSVTLPKVEDIVRYSVRLRLESIPGDHMIPPTHFVLGLAFGLPKDLDIGKMDPRSRIVGTTNCGSSLQLVSTVDWQPKTGIATFLLALSRAEQFKKEGYEVAIGNTSFWRIMSSKVKCTQLEVVGDVDRWDHSHAIPEKPASRKLSDKEERDFVDVLMGMDRELPDFGNGFPSMPPGMPDMAGLMQMSASTIGLDLDELGSGAMDRMPLPRMPGMGSGW